MIRVIDYRVARSRSVNDLVNVVKILIKEWWQPEGGMVLKYQEDPQ